MVLYKPVHVNNTVHVFFQVSQDMATIYMQVSLNFTLEDTKIIEEEPHTVCRSTLCAKRPVRAMLRARIEWKGKKWVQVDHTNLSQKIVDEFKMLKMFSCHKM